ncbi:MAG: T9SS type A sorting domain-containing protein, partial [Endomicrobia bacterium]|nr:T9SS type A sorting domain-containing protein [Endomicrobiia bacterium]
EFGCDSWDGRNGKEDEFMQAKYIVSQWRDIERNLTLNGGVASGGCVFEWTDEWWKSSSNTLGNSGQDTSTDWQNSDYDDPNMNEEWFGIMKISSNIYNSYITSPKKAYNELQKVWNKFVIVEKDNKVYVYPNPAINCEYITFSLLPYDTEKIYIYNIAGELVKTIYVYDVFNTKWFLDNNFGEKVSSGIYFFTIKHNGGIIRNKIAVVK